MGVGYGLGDGGGGGDGVGDGGGGGDGVGDGDGLGDVARTAYNPRSYEENGTNPVL